MKNGFMMKHEHDNVLYNDVSLCSLWVGYTVEWTVVALGMTLLSLIGYFHHFSNLYAVIAYRWSFLLWLSVPGFIRLILHIPLVARHRSKWSDGAVTAFVIIGLWLWGGYVKAYCWKSDFFYVGQDHSVYHLMEGCDSAHGVVREMQGYEVAEKGCHLCEECEYFAPSHILGTIPSRYR